MLNCPRRAGPISILRPLASRFLRFGRSARFRSKRPLRRNRRDFGRIGGADFGRPSVRPISADFARFFRSLPLPMPRFRGRDEPREHAPARNILPRFGCRESVHFGAEIFVQ